MVEKPQLKSTQSHQSGSYVKTYREICCPAPNVGAQATSKSIPSVVRDARAWIHLSRWRYVDNKNEMSA
jgi:hypothetical protein